jgi:hypothetical protein
MDELDLNRPHIIASGRKSHISFHKIMLAMEKIRTTVHEVMYALRYT